MNHVRSVVTDTLQMTDLVENKLVMFMVHYGFSVKI